MEVNSESPLEDKLAYIDQEIRLLHQYCIQAGYDPLEIEKMAKPFLSKGTYRSSSKTWLRIGIVIATISICVGLVLYVEPVNKVAVAVIRNAAIAVIPVWDWSRMYRWDCILENPLFDDGIKEGDCKVICKGLKQVDRVKNASLDLITSSYIQKELPVVVADGMREWPDDKKNFDMKTLYKLYSTSPVLIDNSVCGMKGVVNSRHRVLEDDILRQAVEENLQDFYLHWENCVKEAGKLIRSYSYLRPYFLPHLVEILPSNMVFASQHYQGKVAVNLPAKPSRMLLLVQYHGQTGVKITPHPTCKDICSVVKTVLNPGDMLMVPSADEVYRVTYLPHGDEVVMMGFLGEYD